MAYMGLCRPLCVFSDVFDSGMSWIVLCSFMALRGMLLPSYLCLLLYPSQGNSANLVPQFFNNGKQQCNCFNNVPCSNIGRCPDDRCANTFVGITCQQLGVQYIDSSHQIQQVLVDGDPTTCTSSEDRFTTVEFNWDTSFYFFWIYIVRRHPLAWEDITLSAQPQGQVQPVVRIDRILISRTSLLIKLEKDFVYGQFLRLTLLPKDTCTVEVGIGRNLALGGIPLQSHNNIGLANNASSAREAVDGYYGRNITREFGRSCSVPTQEKGIGFFWSVRLLFNARVNFVALLSPIHKCRITGFSVSTINEKGKSVFDHIDKTEKPLDQYVIWVAQNETVRSVRVGIDPMTLILKQTTQGCFMRPMLPLCEVRVFGEFACPPGKYGALCDITCPDCRRERCLPDWGCIKGCLHGKKGRWCKTDPDDQDDETFTTTTSGCKFKNGSGCNVLCSENCAGDGDCNRANGHCLEGCKPGFLPENCIEHCNSGYYGINCSDVCSHCSKDNETNEHLCDFVTGNCSHGCAQGYTGDECEIMASPDDISSSEMFYISSFIAVAVIITLTIYIVFKYNKRNMSEGEWYDGWEEWYEIENEENWDFPPESFFEETSEGNDDVYSSVDSNWS